MAMASTWRILILAALLVPSTLARADDKASAENKLAPLERFVGEWEVEGKWSSGESLHARSVYEWGLAKKIMTAKTFVRDGDKEYQRYEGVLAWHPEKKSLFEISFAFDGAISEYLIEANDADTLNFGWTPFNADKPANVRQVIKFLDKNHFLWTVSLKQGEDWQQIMEATWKKKEK
jgi:hypothetical protein